MALFADNRISRKSSRKRKISIRLGFAEVTKSLILSEIGTSEIALLQNSRLFCYTKITECIILVFLFTRGIIFWCRKCQEIKKFMIF